MKCITVLATDASESVQVINDTPYGPVTNSEFNSSHFMGALHMLPCLRRGDGL